MRAKAYCAHPSTHDHWTLRCMSRCPNQIVSLKRDPQCLSPQASLVLIYQPTNAVVNPTNAVFCLALGTGMVYYRKEMNNEAEKQMSASSESLEEKHQAALTLLEARLKAAKDQEMSKIFEQHRLALSEIKKKQWVNILFLFMNL
ncbi:hypothetical protein TNCV_820891 [Trichonephila clavipes]|nr:hypothetical protein TNCV_820891 [Trichonephila clavipes]